MTGAAMVVVSAAVPPSPVPDPPLLLLPTGMLCLLPFISSISDLWIRCSCAGVVTFREEQRGPQRRSTANACVGDVGIVCIHAFTDPGLVAGQRGAPIGTVASRTQNRIPLVNGHLRCAWHHGFTSVPTTFNCPGQKYLWRRPRPTQPLSPLPSGRQSTPTPV